MATEGNETAEVLPGSKTGGKSAEELKLAPRVGKAPSVVSKKSSAADSITIVCRPEAPAESEPVCEHRTRRIAVPPAHDADRHPN